MFFLLMVAAQLMKKFEMTGMNLSMVVLMKDDPKLKYELSYYEAGGWSILIVCSFYFFVALVRIMVRTVYQTSAKSITIKN